MALPSEIIETIELIRESFDGAVKVYTEGSCVKFAMVLKHLYPDGTILFNIDHAIFELDGMHYDINGFAECLPNYKPLQDYGILTAYKVMNLKYKMK